MPNWSSPWIPRKAIVPVTLFAHIIIINGFSSLPFSSLVFVLEADSYELCHLSSVVLWLWPIRGITRKQ